MVKEHSFKISWIYNVINPFSPFIIFLSDRIIHHLLPNNNKVVFSVLCERFFFPTLQLHSTYLSHPKCKYNYLFASSFDILCLFNILILIIELVRHDGCI
jgi:hypothetical protein